MPHIIKKRRKKRHWVGMITAPGNKALETLRSK